MGGANDGVITIFGGINRTMLTPTTILFSQFDSTLVFTRSRHIKSKTSGFIFWFVNIPMLASLILRDLVSIIFNVYNFLL